MNHLDMHVVTAMLTYLGITLGGAAIVLIHHWFTVWRTPWNIAEEALLQCPDCHCAFVVRRHSPNGRCPRCDRLCTARRH